MNAKLKTAAQDAHDAIGSCIHEDRDLSNFDLNENTETINETPNWSTRLELVPNEKLN